MGRETKIQLRLFVSPERGNYSPSVVLEVLPGAGAAGLPDSAGAPVAGAPAPLAGAGFFSWQPTNGTTKTNATTQTISTLRTDMQFSSCVQSPN
jgi:hypothetical protein